MPSCPTTCPTAPEAAETTSVSPAFGSPMSFSPTQAVRPGMPSTPSAVEGGASFGSSGISALPGRTEKVCQPKPPSTQSPSLKRGSREAATWPTAPHSITPPIATGFA